MSELDRLNKLHDKAIKDLQASCQHKVTAWEEVIYMPGGMETELLCKRCGSSLARRDVCPVCSKTLVSGVRGEPGVVRGAFDKRYPGLVGGCYYHGACAKQESDAYLEQCHATYTEWVKGKNLGHSWDCNQKLKGHTKHHTGDNFMGSRTWDGQHMEVMPQ